MTHRLSFKSVLLPTSTMMTSLPRSARTSSTHLDVFWNEARSGRGACISDARSAAASASPTHS
jgi:hypothetical protein